MLIEELNRENETKLRQMEDEHNAKVTELKEDEAQLRGEMTTLQKYQTVLEREKHNEKNLRIKLEEELLQNSKNHEEEVQLRLKFESKLNNMHSIHRDLGTKYRRALLDIETLQNTNELLNSKKLEIIDELNRMKSQYAEQNTKMAYDREKILALEKENKIKIEQVNDLLNKTSEMQEKYDHLQYQHQLALKKVSEQKLTIDVNLSQIQTLKNEKSHLRQSEYEARMMKETFENKLNETTQELRKVTDMLQISQREVLGFSEIKKEREERIDKLKASLDELTVKFNQTDSKLSKTAINLEKVTGQLESVNVEYHNTVEKLKKINKARNDKETKLSLEKMTNLKLRRENDEKRISIKSKDKKIDEQDETIRDKEKEISKLNSDKDNLEKRTTMTINQLNDKIANITILLNNEQDAKEHWIDKFEKEQKSLTQVSNELLQVKSINRDLELKIKDLEIRLENQQKTIENIQKTLDNVQDKANQYRNKYDNAERELKTKKEILKQIEKQKEEVLKKQQLELDELKVKFDHSKFEYEMHYEDLMSKARVLQEAYINLAEEHKTCEESQERLTFQIKILNSRSTDQGESNQKLNNKMNDQNHKIIGLEDQIKKLKEQIDSLRKSNLNLEDKNTRLQIDHKKQADELKVLYKQIRKLESNIDSKVIEKEIKDHEFEHEDLEDNENQHLSDQNQQINDYDELENQYGHTLITEQVERTIEKKVKSNPTLTLSKTDMDDNPLLMISKKPILEKNVENAMDTRNNLLRGSIEKKPQTAFREETPQLTGMPLKIYKTVTRLKDTLTLDESKFNASQNDGKSSPMGDRQISRENSEFNTNKLKPMILKPEEVKIIQKHDSTKNKASEKSVKIEVEDKSIQANFEVKIETLDAEVITDLDLLNDIVNQRVQMFVKDHFTNISPIRNDRSEKTIPTEMYDRSQGGGDESNMNDRNNPIYMGRASVNHDFFSNSPILSKNSIHQMSNNSYNMPLVGKNAISHIEDHTHYMNNPTPILKDLDRSIEYTDEPQPTQRSDDLLNTSAELEPTSRQSQSVQAYALAAHNAEYVSDLVFDGDLLSFTL